MQLTLIRSEESAPDSSTVTLLVPTTSQRCSICDARPPCWFVAPGVVSNTEDLGKTALGTSDCCSACLNDMIDHGTLVVVNVDPASF